MTLRLASFSKKIVPAAYLVIVLGGCATTDSGVVKSNEENGTVYQGATIAPPVGSNSRASQRDADNLFDQIPEHAREDEVSLPIESVPSSYSDAQERRRAQSTNRTDSEILASSKSMDDRYATELGSIDQQLGVEPKDVAGAPSYIVSVQSIKSLYRDKKFESALVEVNDLLRFYPNATQLLLMKGTLHQRMGAIDLALSSYNRAFELEPSKKLQAQISFLKRLVAERERLRKPAEGVVIPGGVQTIYPEVQ